MDDSRQDSLSQFQLNKSKDMSTTKTKSKNSSLSYLKKILKLLTCIVDLLSFIINKLNSYLSKFSIVIQFTIYLIPLSVVLLILIYIIHIYFYESIYDFNFSKVIKEEFLDYYITQIDDLKTELTAVITTETKIDLENQLFFQVYFKELASIGFLNNEDGNKFLPDLSINNYNSIFSSLNRFRRADANFTLDADKTFANIDIRIDDNLGELAKLYYYMFPYIWCESLNMNTIINQSFFVSYEFDEENKLISNSHLFFRYPKNIEGFIINNNFIPNSYLINPIVSEEEPHHFCDNCYLYEEYDDYDYDDCNTCDDFDYYFYERWYNFIDYDFRKSVNKEEDSLVKISLFHLNVENDGHINKTLIINSQQYIKDNDRYYIINIIFFINQDNLKEGDNDYTSFIMENNITNIIDKKKENEIYSENLTYVLTNKHSIEYSMTKMDYRFFHLGLYRNEYDFYLNGILYDSFDLDYFYDYTTKYTSTEDGEYDLKFYTSFYLYKSLFQNIQYKKIHKNRDEIFLYHFDENEKVKQICEKIDFPSFRNYIKRTGINCFDKRNKLYYDENNFRYVSMVNDSTTLSPIYPYCSCLPLYCLKNFQDLDNNLDNLEIADTINLPNKCQNIFMNYETVNESSEFDFNNKIIKRFNFTYDIINYDYIRFLILDLNQLPGYLFFIIAQIKTSGEVNIHTYYKLMMKIEMLSFLISIILILSILTIIIIYKSFVKYSLIIAKFKRKYEFYVFHEDSKDEFNSNNNNLNKDMKNKNSKSIEDGFINNDNEKCLEMNNLTSKEFFNINDNTLAEDLFLIFSEAYGINNNDMEKYYSTQEHKTKNIMKLNMMKEKNELFELLSKFSLHAPFFRLNLNFDYKMYQFSDIMKKYNKYFGKLGNINNERARLTQNILYELISTECINDYGLITNFNFKYISNIKVDSKKNSIQYTMFENIKNKNMKNKDSTKGENDEDDAKIRKLILKRKNILMNIFKNRIESDDFLNYNKLDSAFNFFLINSYYKYLRQIACEKNNI